jgi:uncharacterized protein (DUF2267 family)
VRKPLPKLAKTPVVGRKSYILRTLQALFRTLQQRVTEGELEDVQRLLPESIQSMIEAP